MTLHTHWKRSLISSDPRDVTHSLRETRVRPYKADTSKCPDTCAEIVSLIVPSGPLPWQRVHKARRVRCFSVTTACLQDAHNARVGGACGTSRAFAWRGLRRARTEAEEHEEHYHDAADDEVVRDDGILVLDSSCGAHRRLGNLRAGAHDDQCRGKQPEEALRRAHSTSRTRCASGDEVASCEPHTRGVSVWPTSGCDGGRARRRARQPGAEHAA